VLFAIAFDLAQIRACSFLDGPALVNWNRRSSAAVATSREGQRLRGLGRPTQNRQWETGQLPAPTKCQPDRYQKMGWAGL
jgi:hypothetical protein